MTAQHRLLRLIRSLNATSTTIGAGMLAELKTLAAECEAHTTAPHPELPPISAYLPDAAPAAPAAPAPLGNAHLPAALHQHAVARYSAPRTHQHIQLHGITLMDHTVALPGWDAAGLPRRDVIWLALDLEGRALQAAQALALAEALRLMATAQLERLGAQEGSAA